MTMFIWSYRWKNLPFFYVTNVFVEKLICYFYVASKNCSCKWAIIDRVFHIFSLFCAIEYLP